MERRGRLERWATLCDAAMVDAWHYTPVHTHRMSTTRLEPSCKRTAPGDKDVSVQGHHRS